MKIFFSKNLKTVLLIICILLSFPMIGQTVIQMENVAGVYKIPCEINGLKLKLVFDTGAAQVCISGSIADMMLENGYLKSNDIKGTGHSVVADGRIVDNTIINIKELKIGDIKLRNVEAVVIHNQSAPLLLGQSAIKRLGTVSIKDNRLIINENDNLPIKQWSGYTSEELEELLDKAIIASENGAHELAVEYFSILYKFRRLSAYGKYCYADCLRLTDNWHESMKVYKEVVHEINSFDLETQSWIYFGMLICCNHLEDFKSAIQYGQLSLQNTNFLFRNRLNIIFQLTLAYHDSGDNVNALRTLKRDIEKYMAYMDIKATDCWEKGYKDPYLAKLFYYTYLFSEYTFEKNKYVIVSAAWGDEEAIECANKSSLTYTTKPKNYEY